MGWLPSPDCCFTFLLFGWHLDMNNCYIRKWIMAFSFILVFNKRFRVFSGKSVTAFTDLWFHFDSNEIWAFDSLCGGINGTQPWICFFLLKCQFRCTHITFSVLAWIAWFLGGCETNLWSNEVCVTRNRLENFLPRSRVNHARKIAFCHKTLFSRILKHFHFSTSVNLNQCGTNQRKRGRSSREKYLYSSLDWARTSSVKWRKKSRRFEAISKTHAKQSNKQMKCFAHIVAVSSAELFCSLLIHAAPAISDKSYCLFWAELNANICHTRKI